MTHMIIIPSTLLYLSTPVVPGSSRKSQVRTPRKASPYSVCLHVCGLSAMASRTVDTCLALAGTC